jgi:hypothetical protein
MGYWLGACSSELGQLARVAIRILSMFAAFASAERSFSVCRSLTGDYEMAQKAETIATRVMIKANWRLAWECAKKILEQSPQAWSRVIRERNRRK